MRPGHYCNAGLIYFRTWLCYHEIQAGWGPGTFSGEVEMCFDDTLSQLKCEGQELRNVLSDVLRQDNGSELAEEQNTDIVLQCSYEH